MASKKAALSGWEKIRVFIGGAGKEVKCNKCGYITSVLQFEPTCSKCRKPWIEVDGEYFMREEAPKP